MRIQAIGNDYNRQNNKQNFGVKVHPNTIKQAAQEIKLEKNIKTKEYLFDRLKNVVEKLGKLGDKETTITMYFPKEGRYTVNNPKLGDTRLTVNNSGIAHDYGMHKDIIVHGLENIATDFKIKNLEEKLFLEHIKLAHKEKGLKGSNVIKELKKNKAFSDEYIGDGVKTDKIGIFTNVARSFDADNRVQKVITERHDKINKNIDDYVKQLVPDYSNNRNVIEE